MACSMRCQQRLPRRKRFLAARQHSAWRWLELVLSAARKAVTCQRSGDVAASLLFPQTGREGDRGRAQWLPCIARTGGRGSLLDLPGATVMHKRPPSSSGLREAIWRGDFGERGAGA